MTAILVVYLYLMLIMLVGMMLWQYFRGTHDLLSFRNVAIVGFCVFQLYSGAMALRGHQRAEMTLQRPVETGLIFTVWVTVFVAIFLWTYNRGFFIPRIAARIPAIRAVPTTTMLWALAIGLVALGITFRFGVPVYPFHSLANIFGITLAVAACGVVGWIWGPRLLNPVVIAGVAAISLSAVLVVTSEVFGRRPLVAAGLALVWGVYFSHFRYRPPVFAAVRVGLIALIPLTALALWTTARDHGHRERTGLEQLQAAIQRGQVGEGIERLSTGQGAGGISMWLIEDFPTNTYMQTRWFHTIYYTLVYPVPRELWPGKPLPLSVEIPDMSMMQGVKHGPTGTTIGPGIMGHVAAEGRWLALIVYALLGGLFIRLLDELTWQNVHSPLVVIALGSSFGQVVGFSRGETAAFLAWFILGVVGVYLTLLVLGKVIERLSGSGAALYLHEGTEHEDAHADAYADSETWDASTESPAAQRSTMNY